MKPPRPPRFETRRAAQLEEELVARARAWIPAWAVDDERDMGRALLRIAARFGSEVAERLDRAGDKLRLGLLDWLAVQGQAARPARVPVVFRLTASARDAKPAPAGTRLQTEAAGVAVILETETEVLLLPGQLQSVVGVDGAADAWFVAPPGLASLAPAPPLPAQWRLKSFAAAGAATLQLEPEQGLAIGLVLAVGAQQYRVIQVSQDIVTLDPPLRQAQAVQAIVTAVTAFTPFDPAAQNRQQHALYLGHDALFDLEAPATITITGAGELAGMDWHYWGKGEQPGDAWQALRRVAGAAGAAADRIVLAKPAGAVTARELVKGSPSRWLRASVATVAPDQAPLRVEQFGIRINCAADAAPAAFAAPAAQGMANTTPLVLENVFFPLGKEPRQFDAFYLGSQEAFSKADAAVTLTFTMADPTFASLTALRAGPQANLVLAGVGADGQLHLFQFAPGNSALTRLQERLPLRPPAPANGLVIELDPCPGYRIPVWFNGTDICIAVAAKGSVWVWHEILAAPDRSAWTALGPVNPAETAPDTAIAGLVYLADGAQGRLCALRGGKLYVCDLGTPGADWGKPVVHAGAGAVTWARIAPIRRETAASGDPGNGTVADGLIGVSNAGKLFVVAIDGAVVAVQEQHTFATQLAPAAVRRQDESLVAVALDATAPPQLRAFSWTPTTGGQERSDKVDLVTQPVAGGLLELEMHADRLVVALALGETPGATVLATWVPFAVSGLNALFTVAIPANLGAPAGAPTLLPAHVLVPMRANQVIVAALDLGRRIKTRALLHTAVMAVDAADRLAVGDAVAIPIGDGAPIQYALRIVRTEGMLFRGRQVNAFDVDAADAPMYRYRAADARDATVDPAHANKIKTDPRDPDLAENATVLVTAAGSAGLYVVVTFDDEENVATLDRALDLGVPAPSSVQYILLPRPLAATARPLLRFDPALAGAWPIPVLEQLGVSIAGAASPAQAVTAWQLAGSALELVVLAERWRVRPAPGTEEATVIVDGAADQWNVRLADSTNNPELSWEYWNGKGWWHLNLTDEETQALKKSGVVAFKVPHDLAASDWAGQTNYWIRARLIGGDYGRETVTVLTQGLSEHETRQTIERSIVGVRAPSVTQLKLAYSICTDAPPTFVLVQDSGALRDQSAANRTPGAQVDAFVPLAQLLGQFSSERTPLPGRALYLGFDAPLLGAPVNLFLLVEERDHDACAPLLVEALVGDSFVPVLASDATRALGESGVLALAFPVAPGPRALFGQTLRWLRLTPAGGDVAAWRPKLLGAYLNGTWARAAETMTHELVGASQGEPNLTLYLARPPVVRDTLALRVKEPLGEEERAALLASGVNDVRSDIENLPGDWVLWRQVTDPGDEAPLARVYALDEATGAIRFGDGRHGMIPPVGRDAIMAVTYSRTAPPAPGSDVVPGNAIAARSPLNLVSPIDGVEEVFAADQAAGGAAPEAVEQVLRFGVAALRHRGRAVTAADVEDLVLQRAPDVAQARCFTGAGQVRLVVVMRGADPLPGASRRRALQRMLADAASPALAAPGALHITGPVLRRLRVDLRLRVASLDDAGPVARAARARVEALFDTVSGGVDGGGWPLGANPGPADVAVALAAVPQLAGIAAIALHDVTGEDAQPWPDALARDGLPWLVPDGVRIVFETIGEGT